MAIGTVGDFKIYEEMVLSGMIERITQNIDVFNQASRNAIRMTSASHKGHYAFEAFWKQVGLISRRDITSVAAVADTPLAMGEFVSVKVNRKIGPAAHTKDSFRKLGISGDSDQLSRIVGGLAADQQTQEMLNSAIRAVAAGIIGETTMVHTIATNGTMTTPSLVNGLAKFGDAGSRIVAWLQHSKPYYDLVLEQIAGDIVNVADFAVRTARAVTLDRPVVVSDASVLVVTGTPDLYRTLGLAEGAVTVEDSEEQDIVIEDVTGLANLVTRYQGEYAYNVSVKGMLWDVANGGANPNDTALGTETNWDLAVTSLKDGPGIAIVSG
jgi:hypothetical protein